MDETLVNDLLDLENAWHNLKNKSVIATDACRVSIEATGKALDAFKEANSEAMSAVVAKSDEQGSRNLEHVRKRPASALARAVLHDSSKTASMLTASNALELLNEAFNAWASLRDQLYSERASGRIEARFFDVPDDYQTGLLVVQQDTDRRTELVNLRETTLQTARKLESDVPEPIKVVAPSTAAFDLDSAPPPVRRLRADPVVPVAVVPAPAPTPAVEVPLAPVEPRRVSRVVLETGEIMDDEPTIDDSVHEARSVPAHDKQSGLTLPSWVLPASGAVVAVGVCVAGFMLGHKTSLPVAPAVHAAVPTPAPSPVPASTSTVASAPVVTPPVAAVAATAASPASVPMKHVGSVSAAPVVPAATTVQRHAPHAARVTHKAGVYSRPTERDQVQVENASKAIDSFFAHRQ